MMRKNKVLIFSGALFLALALGTTAGFAAEEGAEEGAADAGFGLREIGIALGAGIAMSGAAIGTARAQAAIGAGGTAALAEKPELFGRIFILVALPETIVVLGFVIALLLWTKV